MSILPSSWTTLLHLPSSQWRARRGRRCRGPEHLYRRWTSNKTSSIGRQFERHPLTSSCVRILLIILPNPSPRWTRPLFRAPIWFPKACGSGYLSGPIFLPWLATLRTVLLGMLRILFSQFTWAEWCGKHVNPVHIFGLGCDIRPNQRVGPGYSQIFGRHCAQHILLPCTCTTVHMVLDTGLSHTSATIFYLSINSFVFCVHN